MRFQSEDHQALLGKLRTYRSLRERLLAELPGIDAETLADTLEGITDLREMLAEVIRSAIDDQALAAGLSTRLSEMKARLQCPAQARARA